MSGPRPSTTGPAEGGRALRRFIVPGVFVTAVFVALFLRRPDDGDPGRLWTFAGPTMGTTWTVKVVPGDHPDTDQPAAEQAIIDALADVNGRMSTWLPDSELSRFNDNPTVEPVPVSDDLRHVLREALRLSEVSGGAFDVTVGPLVNAWGFGPTDGGTPPTDAEVEALRPRIGYQRLTLDDDARTLRKAHPEMRVDLSAIAKGYGVDRASFALDKLGYARYMVEVGGEVRAKGLNATGQPWQIGIEKPDEGERAVQEVVPLRDMAMATSGNYRNFYEKDGKRLSHTIDPTTGHPVDHRLASVSVFHPDCMTADGWATTLNVLGEQRGYDLAVAQDVAALLLIKAPDGQFTEKVTPAFERMREREREREGAANR